MLFYVSWHASEVKFTVVFSSICVIRWPSIRNLYTDNIFFSFTVFHLRAIPLSSKNAEDFDTTEVLTSDM